MQIVLALLLFFSLSACQSAKLKALYNLNCKPTSVSQKDLEPLGLQIPAHKVTVVRILRTSCPSCKADLEKIAELFQSGKWNKDSVHLIIIGYNKPGLESRASFDTFVRERLTSLGIPLEAVQMIWLNKSYSALLETKTASGDLLFKNWKAVPYGMIFSKEGHLVFRDQFSMTADSQDFHYQTISSLQGEQCASKTQ